MSQPLYGSSPYLETAELSGFNLGQRVRHAKFGEGVVLNAEGQGRSARVQVNFEEAGSKWLVVAYANLSAV
jgi:DNA helicase-2/ATP-dependent DNA helicase PcrA